MTYHVFTAFYITFRLKVVQKQFVEEMRSFGGAIDVGKFVTRQTAPAFVIKSCGLRTVEILKVQNRATQYFG